MTLTDEVSLFSREAIATGLASAEKTATDYITEPAGGGLVIHPKGDSTTGLKIDDVLEILKSGDTVLSVDEYGNIAMLIDTAAAAGTVDGDLYAAIDGKSWTSDVIASDMIDIKKLLTMIITSI